MSDSGRTLGDAPADGDDPGRAESLRQLEQAVTGSRRNDLLTPPRPMPEHVPPMLALDGGLAVVLGNVLKPTTAAQRMAVAVLQGDEGAAARALADWLQENGLA